MEEEGTVRAILQEIGIKYDGNESSLQEEIHKLTSDLIIRLKNLLDFNKKQISQHSYQRYSKFLNNVLKVKRYNIDNQALLLCEDVFDETILPPIIYNNSKITHGISLWGLNLKHKSRISIKKKDTKHFYMILSSIFRRLLANSFNCIALQSYLRFGNRKLLKNVMLRSYMRNFQLLRKGFLQFSDYHKNFELNRRKKINSRSTTYSVQPSICLITLAMVLFLLLISLINNYS